MNDFLPEELITNKILLIRGQKVMIDKDLANLFNVRNKDLKQAVRRNIDRFPEDFMFTITESEVKNKRPQIVAV